MNHSLRISIDGKRRRSNGIVRCKAFGVREKFLRFLFGEKYRVTVIFPGNTVHELEIRELPEEEEDLGG